VRTRRRDFFHRDVKAPRLGAHAFVKIKPMHGIHDDRHASHPRRKLTQQSSFWRVGVDDGKALAAHRRVQPPERHEVRERREVSADGNREMADARGFDRRNIRAGRGDAGDRIASFTQAAHLIQQQSAQGGIDGRDVGDLHTDSPSR
jgi:hypothetical protein